MRKYSFLFIFMFTIGFILISCSPEIETCYLESSDSPMQLEITGPKALYYCSDFIKKNSDYFMKGNPSEDPSACTILLNGMTLTVRDAITRKPESDYMCNWLASGGNAISTQIPIYPSPTLSVTKVTDPFESNISNFCTLWSEVSTDDTGKTMCVYGNVRNSWYSDNLSAHVIIFSPRAQDFYFIMYGNWTFENLDGHCVFYEGKITKVGNTPVIYMPAGDSIGICDPK